MSVAVQASRDLPPTERLYLDDSGCFENEARVLAVREDALAFDRTCFYPGGGGQPADAGTVELSSGVQLRIAGVRAEEGEVLWHLTEPAAAEDVVGQPARLAVDRERRLALTRYHTVLHVLNTIALRDYGGWITGCQIAPDYARIDFKLDRLSPALCAELEAKVSAVLAQDHPISHYYLPQVEFRQRTDLLRTLDAQPPVIGGRVRVVEIHGFDAQACGGTHVRSTARVGVFSIVRTENKGRNNKRLYVRLS